MTNTIPEILQGMPPPLSFCFHFCPVSDLHQYNVMKIKIINKLGLFQIYFILLLKHVPDNFLMYLRAWITQVNSPRDFRETHEFS